MRSLLERAPSVSVLFSSSVSDFLAMLFKSGTHFEFGFTVLFNCIMKHLIFVFSLSGVHAKVHSVHRKMQNMSLGKIVPQGMSTG